MAEGRTEDDGINSQHGPFYPEVLRGAEPHQFIPVRGYPITQQQDILFMRFDEHHAQPPPRLMADHEHPPCEHRGCCGAHTEATGETSIGWNVSGTWRCCIGEGEDARNGRGVLGPDSAWYKSSAERGASCKALYV